MLALVGSVALAVALQVREAVTHPLWFTEICNLRAVDRPFADMLRLYAADIHPPLPGILRWILSSLGGGEVAQKALSIAFSAAALVPTFTLGRRLFGARAGVLAAFLMALSRAGIHYGQELEDFSLLWLLSISLAHFAFAWFEGERSRDVIGYVLTGVLACYTHYVSVVVIAVMLSIGLLRLRSDAEGLRRWGLMHFSIALFFAPQVPTALAQYAREGTATFGRFPTSAALLSLVAQSGFASRAGVALLVLLSALALMRARTRWASLALMALGALPVFATRVCVLILPREALFETPFHMLVMAAGVTQLPARWLRWSTTGTLAALALITALRPQAPDEGTRTESALRWVETHARPGDLVVHAETHSLLFFMWHGPQFENRILGREGARVPYFEGGLVVPDRAYITPDEWARRQAEEPSWGVWVDRAKVSHSVVTRAGADGAEWIRAVAGDSSWHRGPVTVWEIPRDRPARRGARAHMRRDAHASRVAPRPRPHRSPA